MKVVVLIAGDFQFDVHKFEWICDAGIDDEHDLDHATNVCGKQAVKIMGEFDWWAMLHGTRDSGIITIINPETIAHSMRSDMNFKDIEQLTVVTSSGILKMDFSS